MAWEAIEVTSVGQPILVASESSVLVESNIGLYQGKYKVEGYQRGRVYLTTHRICYVDEEHPRTHSIALRLAAVKDLEYYGGFLKSSAKITIHVSDPDTAASSGTQTPTAPSFGTITWVCSICSYSNTLPKTYEHGVSDLPVCMTCGMKAEGSVIEKALADAAPKAPPQQPLKGAIGGKTTTCPRCTFENYPLLSACEMCGERLNNSFAAHQLHSGSRVNSPGPPERPLNRSSSGPFKLSFRSGGDRRFYEHLKHTYSERAWEKRSTKAMNQAGKGKDKTVKVTGIHGLEQLNEQNIQKTQKVLGSALEDLSSLMTQAKEVVKLAETYAKYLAKQQDEGGDTSARKALLESSQALGLNSSIVTKEMAHGEETFHTELARQLAEFLDTNGVLRREGGVISLVDLFALYNRARGIDLISPHDLLGACEMFAKLNLPIRLRRFESGVLVVQEAYRTRQNMVKSILQWIRALEPWQAEVGVSAQDASVKFGWSFTVAVEELEMAEKEGALCRDEQISGVRFFENLILPV
ncbi:vacuolar protein-sorting-associated protein 36 [Trichomonascus vanleenenianus]|uniref:ESCRT-II subunit protein VPS36 n=1 Tax=Trichomonascus vanleenenianus TaxID=2268995 RepID=UPI003ECAB7B7